MVRLKVGIIGVGMVGTPLMRWFSELRGHERGTDLFVYDTNPALGLFDDVSQADIVFACVPTPPNPDGSCNTSIVESVVAEVANGRIVVIKSTVPPGTTQMLQDWYPSLKMMFCPESLTESQAWADFIRPSRQLIGVTEQSQPHAIEVLQMLPLAMFQRPDTPIYGGRLVVTATEAEFAKYASNVFGALKVVYANVLADMTYLFGRVHGRGVDFDHVRGMVSADQRIGPAWMDVNYGNYSGFGGFCFPKDTAAFISFCERLIAQHHEKVTADAYFGVLQAGLDMLKAAYKYNERLLHAQGLTVTDVSVHDKDIILNKRRLIRQPE